MSRFRYKSAREQYFDDGARDNNQEKLIILFQDANQGQTIGQEKSYCGKEKPKDFFSLGPKAKIRIQVDSTSKTSGTPEFRAKYRAETCSRTHTEPNGLILSPKYPDLYPNNVDCQIKIEIDDISSKLAIFFSKFELENSNDCMNDFLQIDSGPKFCGQGLPPPYFKNSNSAQIRFKTNDNLSGKAIRGRNLSISF